MPRMLAALALVLLAQAPARSAELQELRSFADFTRAFDAGAGQPRLVLLVSPT